MDDPDYCIGWTGLLGMLMNGTIDMISALYVVTPQRSKCFAFSNPVLIESPVIVYKVRQTLLFRRTSK